MVQWEKNHKCFVPVLDVVLENVLFLIVVVHKSLVNGEDFLVIVSKSEFTYSSQYSIVILDTSKKKLYGISIVFFFC